MEKKNKALISIHYAFLLVGITLFLYSGWNLFVNKSYVPHLLLLTGSVMLITMFAGLIIAKHPSRIAWSWTILAFLNSTLIFFLYFYPNLLKELYPLSIWIFLAILIASLQQVLDRSRKKYHSIMRIFNFGLILLLIPAYLMKIESPIIWTIFSWLTMIIMLVNLVLFLLPVAKKSQSR